MLNDISDGFVHGEDFRIGSFCKIHPHVIVGNSVTFQSFVEIRSHTIIGDACYIDSGVKMSGECTIGTGVTIRYDAIIARNVIIKDYVFIAPQVMFINIPFGDEGSDKPTIVHTGVKIGTGAKIMPGVEIARNVQIGAGAIVVKDCLEEGAVYRASSDIVAKIR